jgi:hypothetical protein
MQRLRALSILRLLGSSPRAAAHVPAVRQFSAPPAHSTPATNSTHAADPRASTPEDVQLPLGCAGEAEAGAEEVEEAGPEAEARTLVASVALSVQGVLGDKGRDREGRCRAQLEQSLLVLLARPALLLPLMAPAQLALCLNAGTHKIR